MMKFLKILSVFLLAGLIFSACQKQYDIIDGTATGTLKEDAGGDCMPVTLNGIYTANVTLGSGNFVDIQVNVDNIGTYDIRTDTVNGYFFHGTGAVAVTGLNTIRLQASGKPIISGTDIFRVKFSGTICELNVSVVSGATTSAVFTLRAATTGAACTGALQSGAYNQGLATSSFNTVTVFADVTTAGTYTAATTTVNGVSFAGSGTLAVGTNQPIVLTANGGTPAAANTFNYPVTAGTSTCNFDVVYGAPLPPAVLTATCSSVTVNGSYQAGTVMTSANTITIPVTVTTAGTYTASAVLQNGVSFSGSGVLTTSSTSVTLTASATVPAFGGNFNYPLIVNGAATCSATVVFTGTPAPAAYTIDCTGAVANGNYQISTVLTSANTITIHATATTPGSYSITTNTPNGVSFSGAGTFTVPAGTPQAITLTATSGSIPTGSAGPVSYIATGGGSNCTFNVTYTAAPAVVTIFYATIDGTFTDFSSFAEANISSFGGAPPILTISGNGVPSPPVQMVVGVNKTAPGTITTGTYVNTLAASIAGNYTVGAQYNDPSNAFWIPATILSGSPDNFTINITTLSGGRAVGTFSGTIRSNSGLGTSTKTVTGGVFNVALN